MAPFPSCDAVFRPTQTLVVDTTIDRKEQFDYVTELNRICLQVAEAVMDDYQFIVLSDRLAGPDRYHVPLGCFISANFYGICLCHWIEVHLVLSDALVFYYQSKITFRPPTLHFCSKLPPFSYISAALGVKI